MVSTASTRGVQSKFWCFTLNNYTPDEEASIQAAVATTYIVYGREVGQCGTPHLQGYVEFEEKKRMSHVKTTLGTQRLHLETRNGKAYQAAAYCRKDGDFFERGEVPRPPVKVNTADSKKRWREVLDKSVQGDWAWLAINEPYLWLMNEKKIRSHFKCKKSIDVLDNEWVYGPTGTGKSREARERYPDAYIKDASTQWWDGYNGEDVVIIEDFDKYHVKMGYYLKIWADHYAFPAQIKGGQMMVRPSKIIVTSNYSPSEIWQDVQTVGPIERRFKLVYKAGQPTDFNFPVDIDWSSPWLTNGDADDLYEDLTTTETMSEDEEMEVVAL